MTAADRPDSGQDDGVTEGPCSGDLCWYWLPVVDGLVVAHSGAGTLEDCEGAGRPPLPPRRPADPALARVLAEVAAEVERQDDVRGDTDVPNQQATRDDLLSLAAYCVRSVQAIDRRTGDIRASLSKGFCPDCQTPLAAPDRPPYTPAPGRRWVGQCRSCWAWWSIDDDGQVGRGNGPAERAWLAAQRGRSWL